MLEGCAARAGLATGELSDVMKIQAQIIGSLIRKAAVEVSLHPARIQGSEAKGAVCGEHRNESTPWRKRLDPASVPGVSCYRRGLRSIMQSSRRRRHAITRKCGDDCPETRGLKVSTQICNHQTEEEVRECDPQDT